VEGFCERCNESSGFIKKTENFLNSRETISFSRALLRGVRFQVLTAASMKMAVFWIVAPCRLV
jgi:hypothetical protein